MKPIGLRILSTTITLTLALALTGCGPEAGGNLALKIHYTPRDAPEGLRTEDPPTPGEAPNDISDYRICVSGEGMDKPKCENFNRADNPSGAKLGGLKPGENRTVTFQGYNVAAQYEVRWCGNITGVDVQGEKTTQVTMFITVCGDFTALRNSMGTPRAFHTSTLLPDGRVMIIGGFSSVGPIQPCDGGSCHTLNATSTIDIYNPQTGSFEPQSGLELTFPRGLHTATVISDDKLLVAGGAGKAIWRVNFSGGPRAVVEVDTRPGGDNGQAGSSAELIDLNRMTTQEVSLAGTTPRAHHTAIGFSSGDVMLVGGIVPATNLSVDSIGRYQSASNDFINLAGASRAARQGMASTQFADQTFLIWGGNHATSPSPGEFAEILYEEADGEPYVLQPAFIQSVQASLGDPAFYASAAPMGDNTVLVCGGMVVDQAYDASLSDRPRILNTFRVLEMTPGSESILDAPGQTMSFPRAFHSTNALAASPVAGEIMVAGGTTYFNPTGEAFELTDRVEFISSDSMSFESKQIDSRPVALLEPRAAHTVTVLQDGTLLFSGGFTSVTDLQVTESAEIYNPSPRSLRVE